MCPIFISCFVFGIAVQMQKIIPEVKVIHRLGNLIWGYLFTPIFENTK